MQQIKHYLYISQIGKLTILPNEVAIASAKSRLVY